MHSVAVDDDDGPLLMPLGVDGVPCTAVGEWLVPFITAGEMGMRAGALAPSGLATPFALCPGGLIGPWRWSEPPVFMVSGPALGSASSHLLALRYLPSGDVDTWTLVPRGRSERAGALSHLAGPSL